MKINTDIFNFIKSQPEMPIEDVKEFAAGMGIEVIDLATELVWMIQAKQIKQIIRVQLPNGTMDGDYNSITQVPLVVDGHVVLPDDLKCFFKVL